MTDEEQFAAINQPDYFNKLKDKVNAIKSAMYGVQASAPEITTVVDGVVVVVSFMPNGVEGRLRVGRTETQTTPEISYLYDWVFPIKWLDGATPATLKKK
jgi:hypothetical protein